MAAQEHQESRKDSELFPAPASSPAAPAGPDETATGKPWPWNFFQATLIVAGAFILSQLLAVAIYSLILRLYNQLTGSAFSLLEQSTVSQFVIIVLAETFVVLGVGWLLRRRGISLRALGFGRPRGQDFWLPVMAFVLYMGVFLTLASLLRQYVPGLDTEQKQDIGFDNASGFVPLLMVFLALVVAAPVAEEVLFRGFFFGSLRQRNSFVVTTLLTSVLFGAAHLLGGEPGSSLLWIAGIDTLVLSVALCYLREKTGRLWAPILLHSMKNSLAFTFLFVFPTQV